ncbi:MAG: hypothetical protein Kow0037_11690 [Calditrichia bacterium]
MTLVEIIFLAALLFGIVANFFSLPGNFLVVLNAGWYGLMTGFSHFTTKFLLTLLLIALLVELLEYFVIAFGARRFGASRSAAAAGAVGGLLGSISGFFVSPVLGAVIGGFAGVIIGTIGLELLNGGNLQKALHSTYGALLGRLGGLTIKVIGTVTMVVLVLVRLHFTL